MSRQNRRQFLEQSMFASAAAVAAAGTMPLWGDDTNASNSPNEKLGLAIVGTRGRGSEHIAALAGRKDVEVLYLVDVDHEIGGSRVRKVADRQGGREPQLEADLRRVLDDERVDIISIATPNHWHSLQAIWAIQAGKDVYVEKPVSHNVSEGRRVVQAARKYDRICQTGTQCRSNPGMREAMEFVHSGQIGAVKVARGLCYKRRASIGEKGDYQPPSSVNYDLWSGPAPLAKVTRPQFHYDWHWQWAYGNGDLGNQGIHQMDLCRWALNVNSLPTAVVSYGGRVGYVDAGETANTQVVVHDYGDKSLVFEVRGLETSDYKGARVGIIIEGAQGYVVMTSYSSGAAFDKDGNKLREFKGGGDDLHYSNFIQAVRSRKREELTADIEDGHLSSALCHLGNISLMLGEEIPAGEIAARMEPFPSQDRDAETVDRTLAHLRDNQVAPATLKLRMGRILALEAAAEKFAAGCADANPLLTREYRAPYVVPAEGQV